MELDRRLLYDYQIPLIKNDILLIIKCLNHVSINFSLSLYIPKELIILITWIYIECRLHKYIKLSLGGRHAFLTTPNYTYCCGSNGYGQLSKSKKNHIIEWVKCHHDILYNGNHRFIKCGKYHTFVYNNNGLYSAGRNKDGQLGRGNYEHSEFTRILIDGSYDFSVNTLSCGYKFTLLLTNRGLYGCGSNKFGQLGTGTFNTCYAGFKKIDEINDILSISCGGHFSFIITKTGLWGSGNNMYGQLGLGDNVNRNVFTKLNSVIDIIAISCGKRHSMSLTKEGLFSCGINTYGQLGLNDHTNRNIFNKIITMNPDSVLSFSCGETHSILLTKDGLYSCGCNYSGQLCHTSIRYSKVFIKIIFGCSPILFFECYANYTMILTLDGLYGCGKNTSGVLGIKDSEIVCNTYNNLTKSTLKIE